MLGGGALKLLLSGDYSLTVTPEPGIEYHCEDWRLLPSSGDPRGHLVLDPDEFGWIRFAQDKPEESSS